ncbi:ABC transporter substrate-binding protein [Solirubrobacter phytolaccae]|uniref:ABC transporter substrate-binding protein n=1 Tax=Solirubrobacter phytolaccae TaxID=1404360 RepID=A0A9X3NDD8_9ACTN|nr:ABC transporter substrate-binding protein [Solirubrobacter phytolaccae]MDA0184388.1 ABC transporter substrate-binding protein [Solirubrobacter phytolaccae]
MTRRLLTAVLLCGFFAACGDDGPAVSAAPTATATAAGPVTLRNCGLEVRVEAPPQRAVALSQPATEILLALGLEDRIAGANARKDELLPAQQAGYAKVPKLPAEAVSFERVLKAEPDFAYSTFRWSFSDEGVAPREKFEQLGVPTYLSTSECTAQQSAQPKALTIDDVYAEITDVARIFGVEERGAQVVADLKQRMQTAAAGLKAEDVSLLWWYANPKTPYIAGCCGAPGIMTKALGATNANEANRALWPEISWEAILEMDPTVLVLADMKRSDEGAAAEEKIRLLESDPVASRLTAVREKRYIIVPAVEMDPGLRNVDGIEKVAAGLRELGL